MSDHDHSHLDDWDLRVRALETLLVEKGYVDPAAVDRLIETYETQVGPHNGARVVARAWADPAYADWLAHDATAAIADGDVVRLGKIPAGTNVRDHIAVISDAFTASSTYKMGFQYVDGVDVTAVPQDDDYFTAASTALSSVAVQRKTTTTAPLTLPKDAYLIVTNAGAAQAAAGIMDVTIFGRVIGIEA